MGRRTIQPFGYSNSHSNRACDSALRLCLTLSLSLTQALSSRSLIGNDRGEYVVTTGNIRDWILVLDDLHLELEAVITKGTSTVGEEKGKSLKAESFDSFVDIIQVLCQLLECKPLVRAIEKAYCNAGAFLVSHGQGLLLLT